MSLIYQENINNHAIVGVWKSDESLEWFLENTFLTPDDMTIIKSTKLEKRKIEKLATRILLQKLIPLFGYNYNGLIKLATGKPCLHNCNLDMSVSHCKGYVAVLLTKGSRAGIDIQDHSLKIKTIAHRVFSEREIETFNNDLKLYTRAWSAKEALFKFYEKGGINFIRDLSLYSINDLTEFHGLCKKNSIDGSIKLHGIAFDPIFELIYCYD